MKKRGKNNWSPIPTEPWLDLNLVSYPSPLGLLPG